MCSEDTVKYDYFYSINCLVLLEGFFEIFIHFNIVLVQIHKQITDNKQSQLLFRQEFCPEYYKNAASRNSCQKRSWLCLLSVGLIREIRIENPDGPHRSSYQHPFIKSSPLVDRFDKRTIECAPLLYHCISRRLILISSQLNKRVSTYLSCTYLSYRRPTRLNLKIDHDFLCCASVKYIRTVGTRGGASPSKF